MDHAALAYLRHELRTPLNHIIGYSEMLLEDTAGADHAGLAPGLRQVHEYAQQLLTIINDLVRADATLVDTGRLSAELAEPLSQLMAAATQLKHTANEAGEQAAAQDLERVESAVNALYAVIAEGMRAPESSVTMQTLSPAPPPGPANQAEAGVILIIDDNAANREILQRRLTRDGHQVLQAPGGREALELLGKQSADLILLDVMMPGMDGYELLQLLKADAALRDIPVLMISAIDEIESVVRCVELGAEDYLPKPFDPVLLRARIGACLEKKRLRDREAQHLRTLAEWSQTLEQRVAEQVAMVERLGRLKRFFSPQLAELIVAGGADDPLQTHRRKITVCFLDLRGFTAFAETAAPEDIMGVLRDYHAEMGKLILQHEGTLERFTGDGMMIFFNDPVPVPNADERSVRMAIAMRERVAGLVSNWLRLGYDLDLSIGIAEGYATIGAIGFEGRWDYGAIGSVTNLAARLCAVAQAGQILVAKRVVEPIADLFDVEPVGDLQLKGFHKPIPAYNVIGPKG